MDYTNTFTVSLDDQNINCRSFTLDEYTDLIAAKATGTLNDTVLALMSACVKGSETLNKHQAELVLINLWAQSLSQDHTLSWMCDKCGKSHKVKVNFSQVQTSEHELPKYKLGNAVLNLKYPKLFEDTNKFDMVTRSIESISIGSENLTLEELTTQETMELVEAITLEDATKIAEMLLEPTPYLGVPIKCECGEEGVHVISGFKNFFRLF